MVPTSFLVAQMVKNLPAMQESQVHSLGQEDPLEKGMATHSCILAWRIPWTEGYSPQGWKELDATEQLTHTHTHTNLIIIMYHIIKYLGF